MLNMKHWGSLALQRKHVRRTVVWTNRRTLCVFIRNKNERFSREKAVFWTSIWNATVVFEWVAYLNQLSLQLQRFENEKLKDVQEVLCLEIKFQNDGSFYSVFASLKTLADYANLTSRHGTSASKYTDCISSQSIRTGNNTAKAKIKP